ncbi:MAG: L,D-transpeptidase family protein [Clostridiales bacterium]|nr:L,D-transpeptidase family protein [Clostridiales bacterium]
MKRFLLTLMACILLLQALPVAGESIPLDNPDEPQVMTVTSDARPLKSGDKGEDVTALQTRLRKLEYYRGPVSGIFAEVTTKAIRAVQEAYGLPVTGVADLDTLAIIYGDAYRPLAKGDTGEDVKRVQARLSELGYYWGKLSGSYLEGTTAAISNFQKDNGLDSTGKADVKTQERLFSDDIVMPTPDPAATPVPLPAPTEVPDTTFPGKLWYGSTGKGVERLQKQLKYLGFLDRKVTSGFYKHTQAAVKEFQRLNGIKQDGAVGEDTWAALFAADVVRPGGVPKPTAAPTPIPYFIEVDVANQLIKVFRRDVNNEFTDLYKIFTASTGTEKFPSDVGTWTLTGRRARWASFPTWGGGLAEYWVKINNSIAFHSFLYGSNKKVNMGSVNKLGKPASHGCIRLTLQDAKWIYDNIREGVEVWIHEDAPKDPELKYAHRPGTFNKSQGRHDATPEPTQPPVYQSGTIPSTEIKTMKMGSEGEEVFWLQSRLKELGLYKGTITGQYREGTRDAVKAYQKANKLPQNGTADKATQELLRSQVLEEAAGQSLPSLTPPPPVTVPEPTDSFVVGG